MTARSIVLVEWNSRGHHPTSFAHFILALEELGVDLLAIYPYPDDMRQLVARLRLHRGLKQSRAGQTEYQQMVSPRKRFRGTRFSWLVETDRAIRHFRSIENMARKWQIKSGKRLDMIFYASIYSWDWAFQRFPSVQPFLSLPWSGLYLHAKELRMPGQPNHTGAVPCPEKIFRGSLCRGAATLDEGTASQFEKIIGKPVTIFPDVTNEQVLAQPGGFTLEDRLIRFANGRPIVGLFGYLQKSKGVLPLLWASRHSKMPEVCFAFCGEVFWNSFSSNEIDSICEMLTKGGNTWNHLVRIPDEEQMNSVLSVCDILYAAYLDFSHSSGIMTKAALLKKPLIVSDGYLMAERVRQFKLGEVVPQGDIDALVEAIIKISSDPEAWAAKNQPRWSDYCQQHSFERLKESFGEILNRL